MSERRKPKVLVVDDEGVNIIALAQILKPQYEVIVAAGGTAAIAAAKKHMPDIVLLDILMPDISGYEVLSALKNTESTRDIPVIFITGLDGIEEEERGLLLGAVDYITKPFHNSIVRARLATHLKMAEYIRMIEQLCMIDALTGLTNRRGFDTRLSAEWSRAYRENIPLGLLMIDIDNFKHYNDTYGHAQGDTTLQMVSDILRQSMHRTTDLAARWGGEEFAVLLPDTDLQGTLLVAERIRANTEAMEIPLADGSTTRLTVSIGIESKTPAANDAAFDFVALADRALFTAKRKGRNRVCSN